ncbi:MAG: hypothetical protein JW751_12520 [Polyangiaceae bacterium]|nr:hypothetical protein [Polyangiaceae bacterium]
MKHPRIGMVTITLIMLGGSGSARADLAPPEDFVETCTVEQQQAAGETCVSCSVTYEDFTVCANLYEPEGYAKRCKTWGASVFEEVYCKANQNPGTGGSPGTGGQGTGGTISTSAPVSSTDEGCSVAFDRTGTSGLLLALTAMGLLFRRRR